MNRRRSILTPLEAIRPPVGLLTLAVPAVTVIGCNVFGLSEPSVTIGLERDSAGYVISWQLKGNRRSIPV